MELKNLNEHNSLIFEELLYTIFYHCMIITIDHYMYSTDENEEYDSNYESDYIQYRDFILTYCDSSDKKNITPEKVIEAVTAALDSGKALSLTDMRGRQTIIANNKISFVEVGQSEERKVGFASA